MTYEKSSLAILHSSICLGVMTCLLNLSLKSFDSEALTFTMRLDGIAYTAIAEPPFELLIYILYAFLSKRSTNFSDFYMSEKSRVISTTML